MTPAGKIFASACLLGKKCSYDALARNNKRITGLYGKSLLFGLCPELLGNLGCPRERHEISGGDGRDVLAGKARVLSVCGVDRTDQFLLGAEKTLSKLNKEGCKFVIFKENSPSCGLKNIYSGKFDGKLISGCGVTTAILQRSGIKVVSDVDI